MMTVYQRLGLVLSLLLFLKLTFVEDKRVQPDPPIWEYHHEYELFEKVYAQTQTIQRLLNQVLHTPQTCPDPWTPILDNCYYLPLHWQKPWLEAEETCERLGGYLAILNSEEEDVEISDYLRNISTRELHQRPSYIWIGGFDFIEEGEWRWVNGERFNYSNWRVLPEDSPATIRRKENCLDWSEGWNDNRCSKKFHFLCEKDRT